MVISNHGANCAPPNDSQAVRVREGGNRTAEIERDGSSGAQI